MAAAMALTFIGPPKDHHLSGTPFAECTDLVLSQEGANALLRSDFFLDPVGAGDALVTTFAVKHCKNTGKNTGKRC